MKLNYDVKTKWSDLRSVGRRGEVLLENFSPNGEWDIESTDIKWVEYYLDTVNVPFSKLRFVLHLKRKVSRDFYCTLNKKIFISHYDTAYTYTC